MSDSGASGDRMVRAAASGQQSVDRARGELNAQARAGQQQTQQTASRVGQLASQGQARDQQSDQFQQQQDLQQDRLDLQGAEAGFERGGGGRAAALEAEMARGAEQTGGVGELDSDTQERIQGQTGRGLEHDGRWRATEERKTEKAAGAKTAAFKADTDRIKAETYRDQVGIQHQKAMATGKREEAKALAATLAKPINGDVDKFDRFMKGEQSENDWSDLAKYAGSSNELDPSLQADIKSKQFTPRVQQFMRSHISKEGLKFIIRTGSTSDINVDWTAPQMRAFTEQVGQFNALAKSMGPEFATFAGINSVEDKMAFLNTQASMAVLLGMDQQQSADPTGGMTPSLGGPPEGGGEEMAPPVDPNSVEAQDSGQRSGRGFMSPVQSVLGGEPASDDATAEASRRRSRGMPTAPADSPLFNQLYGNK